MKGRNDRTSFGGALARAMGGALAFLLADVVNPSGAAAAPAAKSSSAPPPWSTTVEETAGLKKQKNPGRSASTKSKSVKKPDVVDRPAVWEQPSAADVTPVSANDTSSEPIAEARPAFKHPDMVTETDVSADTNARPAATPTPAPSEPAEPAKAPQHAKANSGEATPVAAGAAAGASKAEPQQQSANDVTKADAEDDGKKTTSYCLNIANPALDARYLLQKKRLVELKADIQSRTASLEKKISELRDWYVKREEFVRKARDNLVGIYASMKAEAAAKQLAEMDEETSSALLAKLDARQSSAILSEMESKKAAKLTGIMAGAVQVESPTVPTPPAEGAATPDSNPDEAGK